MKNTFKYFALRSVLLLCILSVLALCSNCNKCNCGKPPYLYKVYLNFQDAENKDILEEISLENIIHGDWWIVQDKDAVKGELAPDLYQIFDEPRSAEKSLMNPQLRISIGKTNDRYYLDLNTFSGSDLEKITFKFTCYSIFGDHSTAHTIDTYWRVRTQKPHIVDTWRADGSFVPASDIRIPDRGYEWDRRRECYRIVIDGNEYDVEQKTFVSNHDEVLQKQYLESYGKREYAELESVAWIVLNR